VDKTACRKENGNCTTLAPDGLPAQCVGSWTQDKHAYLSRYIEATANIRAKYVGRGGAAFVDLFAGPGLARVRTSRRFIDGSPLIALKHAKSPFTQVVLCDIDPENIEALERRRVPFGKRAVVVPGDCNEKIDEVLKHVPQSGLNIALVDPYSLSPLQFTTIAKLSAFDRMDLFVHFPTSDIRRKFWHLASLIDRFMGCSDWREQVRHPSDVPRLIPILREKLAKFGYRGEQIRDLAVCRGRRVLYHVVYASKHDKGNEIWQAITRIAPGGQRRLF
jgi:three-Cys-motif partner protein